MTQFARFSRSLLLTLTLAASAALPMLSTAETESAQPLVTIRFNQARVYFDQQLYGAISKAVAVKPEVVFDVVSLAPSNGNTTTDKQWQAVAGRNTRSVIEVMNGMGVPMSRINVTGRAQQGLNYDETQVFVR